ncbi:sodium/calcium exchanger 1-like [Frankliniella occidentalis]|uniref:Sodium/calcium exchanger 1-like n=1 Tax=Frankliniella occidentalis TaxID=133901 RepID=A0A6J1THQ0_FRAOC|nr:sodium/calcium exchanger 1-like [Frankliniella occidentalis]
MATTNATFSSSSASSSSASSSASSGYQCSSGLLLPFLDESGWRVEVRGALYLLALLYLFLGVAIVTDIFMAAIESITSKTRKVFMAKERAKTNGSYSSVGGVVAGLREDEPEVIEVRVWNDTVANLTLMALGTSAPEILLAIVEIVGNGFNAGELGPGTIVGSAAFNLLVITAICMCGVAGETKRVARIKVFVVTSLFGFLAYIWLLVVLKVVSPGEVELWEAIVTFLLFPALTAVAYSADRGWCGFARQRGNKRQLELGPMQPQDGETEKMVQERNLLSDGKLDKDSLVAFIREVRKFPGLTNEDAALLAAAKVNDAQPHSKMWYRIGAVRNLSGSRRLQPQLSGRLREVYSAINEHPKAPNIGEVRVPDSTNAIVEFHTATVAVRESIGKFHVNVWRHGNLEGTVKVKVESIDGSAEVGKDYVAVNETLIFEPNELDKQVTVEILDDNQWEPTEEFFLKLTILDSVNGNVELGKISIMEVTILDDDDPGIISFEKRGMLVKESSGFVRVTVVRRRGASGEIGVKWRTIDRSAISGRDFKGGSGELVFKHYEVQQDIEIPIIDDMEPEKDEHFEVELFEPSGGAKIGNINRIAITITNDDAFNTVVDHLMVLTKTNIDAIRVHRSTWSQQIKDALTVNGGDVENATNTDFLLHFVSFGWKALFSLIPPPTMFGGWLCFILALFGIGVMTAIIGDVASIFGCLVGLPDHVTAITLVAIGTSLPDTFASLSAARQERSADSAIGNINGSNSVNVFLGLGLPWLLATIYHQSQGTKFIVPAGSLGFSVMIFAIVAVLAIGILVIRRYVKFFGQAELGGPPIPRIGSSILLLLLWVLYITLSILQIFNIIRVNF